MAYLLNKLSLTGFTSSVSFTVVNLRKYNIYNLYISYLYNYNNFDC